MMRQAIAFLALAALTGCATDNGSFPSLAPRPIEKVTFDEPVRPHPAATPDAALDTEIAARSADLDRVVAGFNGAAQAAERSAGRSGARAVGSDAWLDTQAALAKLDDWRTQASALAATIEGLGSARAQRLDPPYPALDALMARAAAETDREAAIVARVQVLVPGA